MQIVDDYDLRQARGLFRFTKDERVLSALAEKDSYTIPSFRQIKGGQFGDKDGKPVNRLRFTSSVFVEFQDSTNKTQHDLAIAPADITFELNGNIVDREDGSQTFNADYQKVKFKFKKCEFVFNPDIVTDEEVREPKAETKAEDLEDFDDDDDADEDEDADFFKDVLGINDGKRRLKKSNYQLLGCGAKGMLPSKIKANQARVDEIAKQVVDFVTG